MTDEERSRYFGHIWPLACQVKGWRVKDEVRRRHTTGECMRLIHAPITESTTALGRDEVTALFCYLDHLGNPSSLEKSQRWLDCQQDYHAYNRARQSDWHERKAYGANGSGKLRKNRFAGAASAQGQPQDTFDPDAVYKRHLTMKSRHAAKGYRQKKQMPGDLRFVAVINGRPVVGQNLAGPSPTSTRQPAAGVNSHGDENPF